jgi:hypothetical protein
MISKETMDIIRKEIARAGSFYLKSGGNEFDLIEAAVETQEGRNLWAWVALERYLDMVNLDNKRAFIRSDAPTEFLKKVPAVIIGETLKVHPQYEYGLAWLFVVIDDGPHKGHAYHCSMKEFAAFFVVVKD